MELAYEMSQSIDIPLIFEPMNTWRKSIIQRRKAEGVKPDLSKFNNFGSLKRNDKFPVPINELLLNPFLHPTGCMQVFYQVIVNWDGKVFPCCQTFDDRAAFGDLTKLHVKQIWNGPLARENRRFLYEYGPVQNEYSSCRIAKCAVPRKALPYIPKVSSVKVNG